MPGDSGVLVVTRVRSITIIAHEAAGAAGIRHSPRPRLGREINANLGRSAPREREAVCGIRATSLRAKRSNPPFLSLRGRMDCFAPLAMTALHLNCRWLFEN